MRWREPIAVFAAYAAWRATRFARFGAAIAAALASGDETTRTAAGILLVRAASRSLPPLRENLRRGVAVALSLRVLGDIGGREARSAIEPYARSADPAIAAAAGDALRAVDAARPGRALRMKKPGQAGLFAIECADQFTAAGFFAFFAFFCFLVVFFVGSAAASFFAGVAAAGAAWTTGAAGAAVWAKAPSDTVAAIRAAISLLMVKKILGVEETGSRQLTDEQAQRLTAAGQRNSPSRSHFVATHLSPSCTGAPPCSDLLAGCGRS